MKNTTIISNTSTGGAKFEIIRLKTYYEFKVRENVRFKICLKKRTVERRVYFLSTSKTVNIVIVVGGRHYCRVTFTKT